MRRRNQPERRGNSPLQTEKNMTNLEYITALRAERDELRIALESLLPLAVHTSPDDVAVHAARAALVKTKEAK